MQFDIIELESGRSFLFCGFDSDFVLIADKQTGVFTWVGTHEFNRRYGLPRPEVPT